MLGAVIVLAVVGTGLWLFSDDKRWGIVALIVMIWGLVIAAFLIARYLRDLRGAEAKEHDLKLVYDLQLEREIAARREYELTVERDVRAEIRGESADELRDLKAEVLALRANLEELLGRDLGPSYSELLHTAQRQALEESRRSVFDDDDRVNAQSDFAAMPPAARPAPATDPVAAGEAIDDYYGSVPDQPVPQAPSGPIPQAPAPQTPAEQYPADPFPAAAAPAPGFQPGYPQTGPAGGPVGGAPGGPGSTVPGSDDEAPTTVFAAVTDEPAPPHHHAGPDSTLLLPTVGDDAAGPAEQAPADVQDVESVDVDEDQGQHSHGGNTVAELIARMNAGSERSGGGGRRRRAD